MELLGIAETRIAAVGGGGGGVGEANVERETTQKGLNQIITNLGREELRIKELRDKKRAIYNQPSPYSSLKPPTSSLDRQRSV